VQRELSPWELSLFLQDEFVGFMRKVSIVFATPGIAQSSL
jgi:hypothetical protein